MPSYIIKIDPDRDEYVYWSDIVEAPHCVGTRADVTEYLAAIGHTEEIPERFARADQNGCSAHPPFYRWDAAQGPIAEQRGFVPRHLLGDYARLYCGGEQQTAFALLAPFEDEPESPDA